MKTKTLAILVLVVLLAAIVASPVCAAERGKLVSQVEALRVQFVASAEKLREVLFEAALINAEMFEGGKIRKKVFQNQNERLCRLYDTTNWQTGEAEGQNFPLLSVRDLKLWITKLQVDINGLKKAAAVIKKGRVFREEAFLSLAVDAKH
ncbi:MAG: hypothetical protein Q7R92_04010 [bacterium]|nr:hypothetical protein [bacterium]